MYEVNINGIKSRQEQKKKEQEESHVGNVDERRESREVWQSRGGRTLRSPRLERCTRDIVFTQ